MNDRRKLLPDERWQLAKPLLPKSKPGKDKSGRPPAPNRACCEGILWILQTGAAWRLLPDEFPSPAACRCRLVTKDISLRTAQQPMGHKTIQMTVRYAQLASGHELAVVERLCEVTKATGMQEGSTCTRAGTDAFEAVAGQVLEPK